MESCFRENASHCSRQSRYQKISPVPLDSTNFHALTSNASSGKQDSRSISECASRTSLRPTFSRVHKFLRNLTSEALSAQSTNFKPGSRSNGNPALMASYFG